MSQPMAGGVVSFAVKVAGSAIPGSYQVHAMAIEGAINRVASAVLTIVDGSAAAEDFPISASSTFEPGKAITIEAGYDNTNKQIFSGIVTRQTLRVQHDTGPLLDVECRDKAVKMTIGRNSAAWVKSKDSDAISALISNAGLSAKVAATQVQLPELVQYYSSDWDFIIARAEVNGLVVAAYDGTVNVIDPGKSSSSVLTAQFGNPDVLGFETSLNSTTQLTKVTAKSWDYENQKLISADASNSVAGPGNLSSKKLAGVASPSDFVLQTTAAESKDLLTAWAKAQMQKSQLSKITGSVRLQGTSVPTLGCFITLDGLSARFNGDHFVSSVRHEIEDGNWITELGIGMSPIWFVQDHAVEAPEGAGLLPGIGGIYNATVLKIDSDPDGEYRIKVDVPMFNDQQGLWARLTNFYSTAGEGVFFLPEVGDEVIVGFLNQDPRFPVILGSVYSKKNKPYSQFTPNDKNSLKGIVTKSQLRIIFDDENKILTVQTPANNKIVLDDKNKQIEVIDENSNKMVMSSSGIAISSPKSITISADQNVSITGKTGISIESSGGDVATKGVNIQETAQVGFTAKGNATVQVQAGATMTLKGAMVMIN